MIICYLADAGSIHTLRWLRYFAEADNEIHIISYDPPKDKLGNIKLHLLKQSNSKIKNVCPPLAYYFESIQARKIINEIKPDILHAHYVADYGIIGCLTKFKPLVVSAWGSDVLIIPYSSLFYRLLIKKVLISADCITTEGLNTSKSMIELGAKPEKISMISHGVDLGIFAPGQKDRDLETELGNYSPIIISTRNLNPVYDVASLIKAIPIVLETLPKSKFLIIGTGVEEESLKNLSKSLGVYKHIDFLGHIPHLELPRYLRSADIYISTSLSDGGIAVSTIEAMACGIALIVTDIADNSSWVKDGVNGFLVQKRNPHQIADRIIYLCKNPKKRLEFSRINRNIVADRANYHKEMGKVYDIYKNLVEEKA